MIWQCLLIPFKHSLDIFLRYFLKIIITTTDMAEKTTWLQRSNEAYIPSTMNEVTFQNVYCTFRLLYKQSITVSFKFSTHLSDHALPV